MKSDRRETTNHHDDDDDEIKTIFTPSFRNRDQQIHLQSIEKLAKVMVVTIEATVWLYDLYKRNISIDRADQSKKKEVR